VPAGDRPLKAMRHADRWSAILAACPRHAHWLDGEPISEVLAMGGVVDRYRRLVAGERPVASGVVPVGDAWACTNPSNGRGMSLALVHARALRDVAREHLDDPPALAAAWDETTERALTPWYRASVAEDRARLRGLEAARAGARLKPPRDPALAARALLPLAATRDADVFRAFIETRMCLATLDDVIARPGLAERVLDTAADGAPPPPGPGREELLRILA
jgi:flavin-dependent dehydrogenase